MVINIIQKLTAFFASIAAFFGGIFNTSTVKETANKALDLSGYQLVYEDEFDGDALDTDAWFYRQQGLRRDGYNTASQTTVSDGFLTITAQYRENGEYGTGWYSGMLALNQRYRYGYFEIRCTCAPGGGFWSAFWLQGDGSYDHNISRGGVGAAEIDIMEAPYYNNSDSSKFNCITTAIHCNGGDDNPDKIESKLVGRFQGKNIYSSFNTYGLKWTEDEYIFYVNGEETARTSFCNGVSQAFEEVIVSLEMPDNIKHETDFTTSMTVDYVRIYQIAK